MCGKCGKTHHLSWLRYHQQFNTGIVTHPQLLSVDPLFAVLRLLQEALCTNNQSNYVIDEIILIITSFVVFLGISLP